MNITVTTKAKEKIFALAKEKNLEKFYWRVGVRAGGCQGMENYFEFVDHKDDRDEMIEVDELKVIMDPKSAIFLNGMELDWISNLLEKRFSLTLPAMKNRCSCGSSFSL